MERETSCVRMWLKASFEKFEGPFSASWVCSLDRLIVIATAVCLSAPGMLP